MIKLVLVRHGESVWNKENKFTGWTDVDLSNEGIEFAKKAGVLLYQNNYDFDIVYTSVLKRAIDTCNYIINEMKDTDLTIKRSYKLNERHYGALQGLNKAETAEKYGADQVKLWRRSSNVRPPELSKDDPRYPGNDPKYAGIDNLPTTENLEDTIVRVVDYFENEIKKELENGRNIIIAAHGNSLRALMKYLDNLNEEEVLALELKTGSPICYELDENLKPIRHYYVGEE